MNYRKPDPEKEPWYVVDYEYLGYIFLEDHTGRKYLHWGRALNGSLLYGHTEGPTRPSYLYDYTKDHEDMTEYYETAFQHFYQYCFDKVLNEL